MLPGAKSAITLPLLFLIALLYLPTDLFAGKLHAADKFILVKPIVITAYYHPASSSPDGIESITIPLKRVGHLFLIEARIDDVVGNFVFDTGSSKLVLNKTYFRKYIAVDEENGGGMTGATDGVGRTSVRSLEVSGMKFSNLSADVTSLGHIENRRGVKILGLMGLSLLKQMEIVIDLNHNEIHLFRLDKKGNRMGAKGNRHFDLVQEVEEFQNILLVKAVIGGKSLDFCLDSGAESNVLSSYSSKSVMRTVTIIKRSDLVGVASGQADVLYGMMNDFSLGGRRFPTMKTIITSMDRMSKSYGRVIDGMLGYDFFCQGEICINLVRNEMGITFSKSTDK
ncbi:MAG: pepsin/retropepsin-like aspartic protease family protein [Bacteroidales bacterium]|nr:pepsin/retropepsin-like aspartic protease family protein [Bacteroidales bacterium]